MKRRGISLKRIADERRNNPTFSRGGIIEIPSDLDLPLYEGPGALCRDVHDKYGNKVFGYMVRHGNIYGPVCKYVKNYPYAAGHIYMMRQHGIWTYYQARSRKVYGRIVFDMEECIATRRYDQKDWQFVKEIPEESFNSLLSIRGTVECWCPSRRHDVKC